MDANKTGDFIRELRKEREMTQQQFAELIHVSDKAVSRWETGRGLPDISNLEDIAGACQVSVAELLKGERISKPVTEEDMEQVSTASFSMARDFVRRKKWLNLALGFVIGAMILLIAVIHLTSPIPLNNASDVITVETLSDGEIVAVMDDSVAGYDIGRVTDPKTGRTMVFVSGYDTIWHKLRGNDERILVSLGKTDDMDYVYYYPGPEGDTLIWQDPTAPEPSEGVETLPRLIYNYWLLAGGVLSVIGIVFCALNRKKYYLGRALKITMIPVALTLSMAIVLAGSFGEIYGAPYYLTGILLLGILIYILFIIIYSLYAHKRKI